MAIVEWLRWKSLVVAAVLAWPGLAGAQQVQDSERAAARELGYSGVESYQAGDYAKATSKLEKAYAVLKVPSLGLWSARALIKTQHWVEAAERLRQVTRLEPKGTDAPIQEQAIRDAQAELDALTPRIPRMIISVTSVAETPAGEVQVTLDGDPIATALLGEEMTANPGAHQLVARRGERSVTKEVTLVEAAKLKVDLRFTESGAPLQGPQPAEPTSPATPVAEAPAKAPASGRKVAGWALVGLGAVGTAIGAGSGFLAMGAKSDLEGSNNCEGTECASSQSSAVDSYNSYRTISSIGLIAGAAALTAGVVLVLTAPKAPSQIGRHVPLLWLRVSGRGGLLGGTF